MRTSTARLAHLLALANDLDRTGNTRGAYRLGQYVGRLAGACRADSDYLWTLGPCQAAWCGVVDAISA